MPQRYVLLERLSLPPGGLERGDAPKRGIFHMRRYLLLPVLLLLAAELSAQSTANPRLAQSNVVGDMTNISAGFPFVQWRWGHFIAWDKVEQHEGRIAVYNPSLTLEKVLSFRIDHADSISIISADMTRDGKVVASGLARQSDGTEARFLALITKEGQIASIVRTEPYLPQFICADDDGSVWTVGDWYLGTGGLKQDAFSVVRKYNFSAGLVRGVVERERFHGVRVSFGGPVHAAILRCDGRTVRVYSDVTHQWFEYDKDSGILAQADIETFSNNFTSATGLAVTSTGKVFLSIQNMKSVEQTRIFELTPTAADAKRHWRPVAGSECKLPGPCILEILGIEDGRLILKEAYQGDAKIYRAELLGD